MMNGGVTDDRTVVFKGVLEKVAKIGFNVKKLCVLSQTEFFYYSDSKPHGSIKHISLQDVQAVKRDHSSKGFQFEVITRQKTETFAAESLELCQEWLKAIQSTLLTTRRKSVTSTGLGCSDGVTSPVAKFPTVRVGGHAYEEIDLDVGQPVLKKPPRANSAAEGLSRSHPYETVDLDPGDKAKVHVGRASRGSRAPCTTVDALGGPPGTQTEQLPPPVPKTRPPEIVNPALLYALPNKGDRSNAKSKPPLSPKPVNPNPTPKPRGLCKTVDALRGPPVTQSPATPQGEETDPAAYSEAMPEKPCDLYSHTEQQRAHRRSEQALGEAVHGRRKDVPSDSSGAYSTTYSLGHPPERQLYSEVTPDPNRDSPGGGPGIYCLAKGISINPQLVSTVPADTEGVYRDAKSCATSETSAELADPKPDKASLRLHTGASPLPAAATGDPPSSSENAHALKDVDSTASPPTSSQRYAPLARHEAINKLDQFLSSCN